MKKPAAMIAMGVLSGLVAAGCSGGEETGQDSSSGDTVTLDVIWFSDGNEGEVFKEITEDYKSENPNVEFNIIETPYDDIYNRIRTRVSGGDAPDLARISNPGAVSDALLRLDGEFGNKEEFYNQLKPSARPWAEVNGEFVAVPTDLTAHGLYYNKEYFEQAGVEVPDSTEDIWNWSEFADAIEKVKENSDARMGLAYDMSPSRYSTLIYQNGGRIFSEDGQSLKINESESVEALEYFNELHEREIIPQSIWLGGENPNSLFRSGQAAAHLSGNWNLQNYSDNADFEWGVTYMPQKAQRSSVAGGKQMVTFKDSEHKEEAVKFMKYFISKEQNKKYVSESLFISPRSDIENIEYAAETEAMNIFNNELSVTPEATAEDWSNFEYMPDVEQKITENVQRTLDGAMTPQEAMDSIVESSDVGSE
ncbi:ABC transporter substrate-binding protein [Salibacterium qingdaonense]|uniref:Carbohydrate ABC transporter substrate-binding protein, CUT1 family n=1 Tax=Salibacterium qingdaonense TaxID=266892 RepID=A0A1I4LLC8_9BACI|nr:sugar ABC transporter substrate-binding protein [Salibacterium qingdaonense]SFL91908.1 carbohydrate ABC transporter substrate-binding protein, CUT1 family [Salibacterium qingdaonense]